MLCVCILFASDGLVGLASRFWTFLKGKIVKTPELQANGKEK